MGLGLRAILANVLRLTLRAKLRRQIFEPGESLGEEGESLGEKLGEVFWAFRALFAV